jgi:ribosome-interacting GTPase 1
VFLSDRKYIPALYVLNKCDTITLEELELLSQVPNYVPVCAGKECQYLQLLNSY